ncbi:MAG: PLP-dependent cysteine synthase family protein, partial [Desulfurococcus sp.]
MILKLVEPAALKAPSMTLKEYIDTLGRIISKWRTPIIHVRNDRVLEEDVAVFNALAEFGVRYIPVSDTPGEAGEVSLTLLDPFHEVQGNGLRVYDSVVEL